MNTTLTPKDCKLKDTSMQRHEMTHDGGGDASQDLPEWTKKYPEEYRRFLSDFGIDDRGDRTREAFNYEIFKLAKSCEGEPHFVFEMLLGWLCEDWSSILSWHSQASSSTRSTETRGEPATPLSRCEPVSRSDNGELFGEVEPAKLNDEQDLRRVFATESRARYLALRTGVAFSDATLRRLKAFGYGPVQPSASHFPRRDAYDSWLSHIFALVKPQAECSLPRKPRGERPGVKPWLYVAPDDPGSDLDDYIAKWGGSVIGPVEFYLEAAQIASHSDLAGAIVEVDWNAEAAFLICDVLMRRRVPFLAIARMTNPPPSIGVGGAYLHCPDSLEEIRCALESLPERAIAGMDFSRKLRVDSDED
jgi:hypothetical protein